MITKNKSLLLALLLAFLLNFNTSVASQNFNFTSNLTLGSTGNEVIELQLFLEQQGFLVMPSGVSKGYFGSLTKSALSRYQAAKFISPSVGYFGPLTRESVNATIRNSQLTATPSPTTPQTQLATSPTIAIEPAPITKKENIETKLAAPVPQTPTVTEAKSSNTSNPIVLSSDPDYPVEHYFKLPRPYSLDELNLRNSDTKSFEGSRLNEGDQLLALYNLDSSGKNQGYYIFYYHSVESGIGSNFTGWSEARSIGKPTSSTLSNYIVIKKAPGSESGRWTPPQGTEYYGSRPVQTFAPQAGDVDACKWFNDFKGTSKDACISQSRKDAIAQAYVIDLFAATIVYSLDGETNITINSSDSTFSRLTDIAPTLLQIPDGYKAITQIKENGEIYSKISPKTSTNGNFFSIEAKGGIFGGSLVTECGLSTLDGSINKNTEGCKDGTWASQTLELLTPSYNLDSNILKSIKNIFRK